MKKKRNKFLTGGDNPRGGIRPWKERSLSVGEADEGAFRAQ